jgi:MFS family permease
MAARTAALTLPILVLFTVQFMNGLITSPSITFFPVFMDRAGSTAVFLSLVVMLQRITGLISSLAGGLLGGSRARRWSTVAGLGLFFAGAAAFLCRTPAAAAPLWAAAGLGMGLYSMGSQSAFMDLANPRLLGVLTALYNWAYTAGATLGNPAAGMVLDRFGYRGMGWGLLLVGAVAVAAAAIFLPGHPTAGRAPPPSRLPAPDGRGPLFGYGAVLKKPRLLMLCLLRMLATYGYGMLLVFMPLLLAAAGAAMRQIALFAAVSSICAALAQLAIGRLSDRLSPRWPCLISFAVLALSAACTGLFPSSIPLIFISGTAGVAAAWCLSTLTMPMLDSVTPPAERGRSLGAIALFWNMAMILSGLTGGFLYEAGHGAPFLVSAALGVPAVVLAAFFFRLQRRSA